MTIRELGLPIPREHENAHPAFADSAEIVPGISTIATGVQSSETARVSFPPRLLTPRKTRHEFPPRRSSARRIDFVGVLDASRQRGERREPCA